MTRASLLAAARQHLRAAFLRARVAISGANFAVAETGTVAVVESEGNGRMCTTLPETLVTVLGIEKVVEEWRDLGVLMQLLPRSATGERMNPYTSLWTGVSAADGPSSFHLVLVDAGRTRALADPEGRPALRCIRCSACVNVCPVYRQTGGHAYDTVYAGPIGAILQPQLSGERGTAASLPYASTLCGACADVCPVGIDIPRILVHERAQVVRHTRPGLEGRALRALGRTFSSRERYERAQRMARSLQRPALSGGRLRWFPGPLRGWGARARSRASPSRRSASGGRHVSEAREAVLARIRQALTDDAPLPEVPRDYVKRGARLPDEITAMFVDRVIEAGGVVVETADVQAAIGAALSEHEASRVVVAADLPAALRPAGVASSKITGWRRRSSMPWTPRSRRASLPVLIPGRSRSTAGMVRAGARSRSSPTSTSAS